MEALYLGLVVAAFFFYLHIALTYAFSVKYLSLLEKSENYHLLPMAGAFASVCVFTLIYFFSAGTSFFPFSFNLVMLAVMVAKCFYFQALRKHLGARFPVDKIYYGLSAVYFLLSAYFMTRAFGEGLGAYFDLSSPELSGLPLRERLLPFELSSLVKTLFLPNYLLGFCFYLYLLVLALKKGEKLLAFGIAFTIVSILYTNSYHLFKNEYWIPLNIVADLFEMLRLHWTQREKLALKVEAMNRNLRERSVLRHDLNNGLSVAGMNLYKAKLLLGRSDLSPGEKESLLDCLENAMEAQKMAANLGAGKQAMADVALESALKKVCRAHEVPLTLSGISGASLNVEKIKLESAFTNLIKNAKEANQEDKDFCMEARLSKKGPEFTLFLKDSGAYERIKSPERIFNKGFSTKSSTGRGIGLYSVQTFMEDLGGEVNLLNEQGNVCFALRFPEKLIKFDA